MSAVSVPGPSAPISVRSLSPDEASARLAGPAPVQPKGSEDNGPSTDSPYGVCSVRRTSRKTPTI